MVGAADLEPGELLGIAHTPLMHAPIDFFQRTDSAPAFSPSTDVSEVAAVSELSLTAAAATASPSSALLERFSPAQRVSFLGIWDRLPTHLRDTDFDSHSPEWANMAIEQLDNVLCEFPDVCSRSRRILALALWCLSRLRCRRVAGLSPPGLTASIRF